MKLDLTSGCIMIVNSSPTTEWKEFFSQFGEVVYCTVALDNQDLVKALVRRRVLLQQVMFQMPRGDENYANAPLQTVPESLLKSRLAKMIDQINTQCRKLLTDQTYSASDVFVTFETEQAQRAALKALSVGGVTLLKNRVSDLPSNHVFRERFVLNVVEAKEPSVTRWKDLRTPLSVSVLIFVCHTYCTKRTISLSILFSRAPK